MQLHMQNYKILENKVYFIHIPKTGGTTFHYMLQKNLKDKLFSFGNETGQFVWYGMEEEFSYIENYCLKQNVSIAGNDWSLAQTVLAT